MCERLLLSTRYVMTGIVVTLIIPVIADVVTDWLIGRNGHSPGLETSLQYRDSYPAMNDITTQLRGK